MTDVNWGGAVAGSSEGNTILRLGGTYMTVNNVATHREGLYRKYFIFSLTLYFRVNFKIGVHVQY
jgi:hypothetical protein